jgi:hypothetical protein
MVRQTYPHYSCDYCDNEVIEKKKEDIVKWIAVKRGRMDFEVGQPLLIGYMSNGWQDTSSTKYQSKIIEENLYFCCPECIIKYILKHIGQPEVVPETIREQIPKREPTRFDDIAGTV